MSVQYWTSIDIEPSTAMCNCVDRAKMTVQKKRSSFLALHRIPCSDGLRLKGVRL
jgi:hypothetical protein